MTDLSGPWDDAPWAEAQWYRHAALWAPSGVYGTTRPGSVSAGDLAFSASGLAVTIGTGRATVGGAGFERTGSPSSQSVTANGNATLARRDRVVLRRDLGTHTVAPVLIQGTASATPTAPAITRNDTTWDLPLFSFLVPANNGTTITGVLDERTIVHPECGEIVMPHRTASSTFTSGSSAEARISTLTPMTLLIDPLYAYRAFIAARFGGSVSGADDAVRWRFGEGDVDPVAGTSASVGGQKIVDAGGESPDMTITSLPFTVASARVITLAPFIDASTGTSNVSAYAGIIPARYDAWIEIVGPARTTHLAI